MVVEVSVSIEYICSVLTLLVSRHPNYFGEMLCWIGIWASAASILVGGEWATVVSPLYIINILLFLSGLNRLERSADDK